MPVVIDVNEEFSVGDAWFASVSPGGEWAVVFEDDGTTAYFYASRWQSEGEGSFGPVLDALHIYNVSNVTDRATPSRVKIGWSQKGDAAVLLINNHPHAIFDRAAGRATCRTGFPPPPEAGAFARSRAWDASLEAQFR